MVVEDRGDQGDGENEAGRDAPPQFIPDRIKGDLLADPLSLHIPAKEIIREQRQQGQVSLRQLARLAGVSNPYLSQIERGLRKPSAEILQQIARALRISAETLYVRAGILEQADDRAVERAVLGDQTISERQKQALLEIYRSFRAQRTTDAAHTNHEDRAAAGTESTPE